MPPLENQMDAGPNSMADAANESIAQTQAAPKQSDQRFRALFNHMEQFLALLRPNGTLIEANQAALQFAGLTAEEVIDRPFWQTPWWSLSAGTQTQLQQSIRRAAAGETVDYEVDIAGAGANLLTIEFSLKPISDESGRIAFLVAEGRDVTRRKQTEAELHRLYAELERRVAERTAQLAESQQRYAMLTHISPVGIFRASATGECLYVNQRWCDIAGLSASEALGTGWGQSIHPDDRDRLFQEWQQLTTTQETWRSEYRFLRPDGGITWVVGQAVPEVDATGQVTGYVGTITDITDLKQIEAAQRESESRFRATFEQAAVGIAHVDLDGQWLRVNQRLCSIVGYSHEELLSLRFQDITYPEDLEADMECMRQLLSGESQIYSLEKRYRCKDGSPVWIYLTASLVREASTALYAGRPKYFIAVIEDISERKAAELALQERAQELTYLNAVLARTAAQLEKRNQELDQFAYVASHDLKAPLRAIANLSEWIEEDLAGQLPEENQHQMRLLRGRVHRMEALINGLLEYSRVGRIQSPTETVSVQALLEDVVDSLAPPPEFTIDIAPQMPTLTTKPLLLRQVFANLISNALKHHNRSDGRIRIAGQDQGKFYQFSVSDDGPGIAPEYHDKVFMIFQTLEARDSKESTGIGLSIVKKIIETEGGTIKLDSQPGQGATFSFTWPKET